MPSVAGVITMLRPPQHGRDAERHAVEQSARTPPRSSRLQGPAVGSRMVPPQPGGSDGSQVAPVVDPRIAVLLAVAAPAAARDVSTLSAVIFESAKPLFPEANSCEGKRVRGDGRSGRR